MIASAIHLRLVKIRVRVLLHATKRSLTARPVLPLKLGSSFGQIGSQVWV
jgi:hypothetical protein